METDDLFPGGEPNDRETTGTRPLTTESSATFPRASLLRARMQAPAPIFREDEDLVVDAAMSQTAEPARPFQPPSIAAATPRATELDAQRLEELRQLVERRRLEAEERIATAERLEREALTQRFSEIDRRSEELAAEHQRVFAERLDAAIEGELGQLRQRRQEAETRVTEQFEARYRAEADRLEAWQMSERERIAGELKAEEQRFAERLLHQLAEFEIQLSQRVIEQEQKLAGWWAEAERLADLRMTVANSEVDAA
jgi:hypothetical protein